jgi:hypothetical protein
MDSFCKIINPSWLQTIWCNPKTNRIIKAALIFSISLEGKNSENKTSETELRMLILVGFPKNHLSDHTIPGFYF